MGEVGVKWKRSRGDPHTAKTCASSSGFLSHPLPGRRGGFRCHLWVKTTQCSTSPDVSPKLHLRQQKLLLTGEAAPTDTSLSRRLPPGCSSLHPREQHHHPPGCLSQKPRGFLLLPLYPCNVRPSHPTPPNVQGT